jgi:N-acetylglucosamine malate deacetylase 1
LTSFRSQLRPVKRAIGLVLEQIWGRGFAVAGALANSRADRWNSPGGEQVMIVAPHPDDEAVGCAGTTLLHAQAGDSVCLAIATDGRQSRVVLDSNEMSRQRRVEAGHAARLLQVDRLEWIGLDEGAWAVSALKDRLKILIEGVKPDIIYAPSRIDFHPEHLRVAHALALALGEAAESRDIATRVRIYQIQVPLNPALINLVADVSGTLAQREAVLRAYASQTDNIRWCNRQKRYSGVWYRSAGHAEVFWEVSAHQYVNLHCEPVERWPSAFRGMRNFPLSDPLAYLVGMRERRRISIQGGVSPMQAEL